MNTVAILLATSLLGVDYELVTADSKETVYVITIERELIDQLADGFTINSSLPDNAKNIRQIRIQFATDKAPKNVNQDANEIVSNLSAENRPIAESTSPVDNTQTALLLTPDESLIPKSNNSLAGPDRPYRDPPRLEPDPLVLPVLSSDEEAGTPAHEPAEYELLPEFDQPMQVGNPNRELDLLKSSPKVVLIDAPESPPAANDITAETQSRHSTDLSEGERQQDIQSPDLISTHRDEFVALSSLSTPVHDELEDDPNTRNDGRTDLLLLLMFSITLNLFLGATIYRIYRY
ncbi:MAG: hypothetical protein CMM06_03375 [Rhodopirellula sp.]|nr:hypothetical protein [Rhodopirellula sp.]|tara:strand:- start:34518 stop:35390 length:873 start_codon:yes stop_codon:yes gene_type:complete